MGNKFIRNIRTAHLLTFGVLKNIETNLGSSGRKFWFCINITFYRTETFGGTLI